MEVVFIAQELNKINQKLSQNNHAKALMVEEIKASGLTSREYCLKKLRGFKGFNINAK
jgi:hypothetical protein